jgi:two-component system chemotaxis sensor kinase CheA
MGVYKRLEEEFDFDIVDEFMDHYEVICDIIEPTILNLENNDNSDSIIEELFRIAHNLKSATGFLKLKKIYQFAIFLENILENIRYKNIYFNEDSITWFLKVADQLKLWYMDLKGDKDSFNNVNFEIFDIPEQLDN